jgi:hypothetical protein
VHKRRDKEIDDMLHDRMRLYTYILSKLSKESMNEFTRHAGYDDIEVERFPLRLWMVLKEARQTVATSKVAEVVKKSAHGEYMSCKQRSYESIMDYKRRFDTQLDAYKVSTNPVINDEDVAIDFLYGLGNKRYGEVKLEIMNDIPKEVMTQHKNMNAMCCQAGRL